HFRLLFLFAGPEIRRPSLTSRTGKREIDRLSLEARRAFVPGIAARGPALQARSRAGKRCGRLRTGRAAGKGLLARRAPGDNRLDRLAQGSSRRARAPLWV